MKTINAKNLRDYEYRVERTQEKKQARSLRDQRKGKSYRWVTSD